MAIASFSLIVGFLVEFCVAHAVVDRRNQRIERTIQRNPPCNQHGIFVATLLRKVSKPHRFAQSAFDAIAFNGISDFFRNRITDPQTAITMVSSLS